MKLSLIIPYHNESFGTIKPLLDSIVQQESFDFNELEVLVVGYDLQTVSLFFGDYPQLNIKTCHTETANKELAKQCGIDMATGEFVSILYPDEQLSDDHALFNAIETINQAPANVYNFLNYIECRAGLKQEFTNAYVESAKNESCCGKIYQKLFLAQNNIRFSQIPYADLLFNLQIFKSVPAVNGSTKWFGKKLREADYHYLGDFPSLKQYLADRAAAYDELLAENKDLLVDHYAELTIKTDIKNVLRQSYNLIKFGEHEKEDERQLKDFLKAFDISLLDCRLSDVEQVGKESYEHFIDRLFSTNERKAWVTLLSDNSYMLGEVGIVRSLQETYTKYPIICVITPDVSAENRAILEYLGVKLIVKDRIVPNGEDPNDLSAWEQFTSLSQAGWHNALTKLSIFDLTDYDKLVYVDNDVLALQNVDELFDKPHMSAIKDFHGQRDEFCSGLLVIEPNHDEYLKILEFFKNFKTDGMIHDQLILQKYFKDWTKHPELVLSNDYGVWTTAFTGNNEHQNLLSSVKMMHYIDVKPWKVGFTYFKQSHLPKLYAQLTQEYAIKLNQYATELTNLGFTLNYIL